MLGCENIVHFIKLHHFCTETMRRLRQRRKRRQKWIWGSIGVAITLGSTALAWSYIPTGKGSSSSHTSDNNPSVPSSD